MVAWESSLRWVKCRGRARQLAHDAPAGAPMRCDPMLQALPCSVRKQGRRYKRGASDDSETLQKRFSNVLATLQPTLNDQGEPSLPT
jgi:hypothetical protein